MPAFSERMRNGIELLDGEYIALPEYKSAGAVIAEVSHVLRNSAGGRLFTPVGRLSAFIHSGEIEDLFNPHWSIHLFVRSDVRYQADLKRTDVVANPEKQAGPNRALLQHLQALRDSDCPFVHPELPHAIGDALIKAAWCSEPASVHIYVAREQSFIHFGNVVAEDNA
ncbi:MAG: hypothetical protein JWN74_3313 [Acidobacteriaceae bacterium]|nr:hypothetical protein [Acidobacteriaceae bacterium]